VTKRDIEKERERERERVFVVTCLKAFTLAATEAAAAELTFVALQQQLLK